MKVLTLHQPWASLIALGVKTIETRSWSTQYRGPLAIHAGARAPKSMFIGDYLVTGTGRLSVKKTGHGATLLPLGAIVATCTLVDVVPIVDRDRTPGAQVDGTYLRLLADVVPVDPPVPFKGGQGLTKMWEPTAA